MKGPLYLVVCDGCEYLYRAVRPQADSQALCDNARRILIHHGVSGLRIICAEKGILTSGWVIGIVDE